MTAKFCPARPFTLATTAILALALVTFFAPTALAKAKTVAVLVEGPDAESVRSDITNAVPHGTPIASSDVMRNALAGQGIRGPLGRALEGAQREKTLAHVRKAAASAAVDGTLIARVTKSRRERHVLLLLVATSGAAGDLEDDLVLGLKRSKDDEAKLAASVGTALIDYRPAAGDAEKAAPPTKEKTKEKEDDAPAAEPDNAIAPPASGAPEAEASGPGWEHPRGVPGRDLFELEIGAGAVGRHFGYTVDANSSLNLRLYSVFPAALVFVGGELFPLADWQTSALRNLGLFGTYERSLFLQSTIDGSAVDTTATSYLGGLKWRVMPAGEGGLRIGLSLSYAVQSFGFGSTAAVGLPSVSYRAIRPGLDVRVPLGNLSLLAQAGFRALTSAGDVALRFSATTASGFDVGGGVAYGVSRGWELRALGEYEGYFYSFNSMPGDVYRAKAAVEHFYSGHFALAAIF